MMRYLSLFLLAGCFDSIVSDHCSSGYTLQGGHCIAAADAPDAGAGGGGGDGGGSGGGDAAVCTADTQNDPDNCGACGIVCASGVCNMGVCGTGVVGQIIAIGHDYTHHHATMARVLGDAVSLGLHHDVAVARYTGTAGATSIAQTANAITQSMQQINRPWHWVPFPETPSANAFATLDVVLVQAQLGDGDAVAAAAAAWAPAFGKFLDRGGVVIVLETTNGVSYRFAQATSLYTGNAPVDASGSLAYVVNGADAITQQVISPYMAEANSVILSGTTSAAIATANGDPIAVHLTWH